MQKRQDRGSKEMDETAATKRNEIHQPVTCAYAGCSKSTLTLKLASRACSVAVSSELVASSQKTI